MTFTVAIVGKSNVGKSSLFNLLVGKKFALVEDIKGVTVDIKEAPASLDDMEFSLIDTGGYEENTDINPLNSKIWEKAEYAIKKSHCIIFMINGKEAISQQDLELSKKLRKLHANIILCINKIDTKESRINKNYAYELGFNDTIEVSAVNRIGLLDMYNSLLPYYNEYLKNNPASDKKTDNIDLSLAIIGKPNTGKSTLINKIISEDKLITSNIAGTTRDSISSYLEYKDKNIRIIDTAGLRKKSKIVETLESLSSKDTLRSIKFAQVVALMVSTEEGLTTQDLKIANYVIREGRVLMIVLNKIDLIKNKNEFINNLKAQLEYEFHQVHNIKILVISALKDKKLDNIIDAALNLLPKWSVEIKTNILNKHLEEIISKHMPPIVRGKRLKIKLISQIKTRPPTFKLWVNLVEGDIPLSYLRFVQNELVDRFNLQGIPLRLTIENSKNPFINKN